jgi:hypothetical protein
MLQFCVTERAKPYNQSKKMTKMSMNIATAL